MKILLDLTKEDILSLLEGDTILIDANSSHDDSGYKILRHNKDECMEISMILELEKRNERK